VSKRILVIDDEQMILDSIKIIFEDLGYSVSVSSDPRAGLEIALREDFDLILVDIRMPGLNGAEVTAAVHAARPSARILVITAHPHDELVTRALEAGAVSVLRKPFEIAKVLDLLKEP